MSCAKVSCRPHYICWSWPLCWSNSSTALGLPLNAAWCKGIESSIVRALKSTPSWSNSSMMLAFPITNARCKGVWWFWSRELISSTCSISTCTMLVCPLKDAICKAVLHSQLVCSLTSAPNSMKSCTVSTFPDDDARWNSECASSHPLHVESIAALYWGVQDATHNVMDYALVSLLYWHLLHSDRVFISTWGFFEWCRFWAFCSCHLRCRYVVRGCSEWLRE